MDIAEIAARAREFRARLDAVKAAVPRRFEWYPRFGSLTLSASVDGVEVTPETYASPGEYVFRRRIPEGVSERAVIEFRVSQALSPDAHDRRERGIVVNGLKLS